MKFLSTYKEHIFVARFLSKIKNNVAFDWLHKHYIRVAWIQARTHELLYVDRKTDLSSLWMEL